MHSERELLKEANAARNVLETLRHFVRMVRVAQSARAVRACLRDLERTKHDLARAYEAYDHAVADFTAHEFPMRNTEQGVFQQLKRKEHGRGNPRKG